MLKRSIARSTPAEASQLVEESVQHAKDAISMDLANSKSWYCLGNAYLNLYFQDNATEPGNLRKALKAYQNAERGSVPSANPDLHFNRAMVYRYLEEHQAALDGFTMAGQLDASLPWEQEVESLVELTSRLHDMVHAKCYLKPKKLQALVGSVNASEAPAKLKVVGATDLVEGKNTGVCVQCRLIQGISKGNAVPLHFLVVDSFSNCSALSVLGMVDKGIKENSTLTLLEPTLKQTRCTCKQKSIDYSCLRVEGPTNILVGGMLPIGYQAAPTLTTTTIIILKSCIATRSDRSSTVQTPPVNTGCSKHNDFALFVRSLTVIARCIRHPYVTHVYLADSVSSLVIYFDSIILDT
eukprot:216277-Pyramimonas_sp.AAC.1